MTSVLYSSWRPVRRAARGWRGALAVVAALVGTAGAAQAQIATYQFAASAGTFVPLPATATPLAAIQADDAISGAVPLGFAFAFDDVPYTSVYVSSNGFVSFSSVATAASSNGLATAWTAELPLVAPLWDDLSGADPSAAAHYQTTGTAPNRVFTVEWRNWRWNYNAPGPVVSFQVALHETTNRVAFNYRPEAGTPSFPSASIGLAGADAAAGYLALSNTSAASTASFLTENANLATPPAAGQQYAFTPQPPSTCPTPGSPTQTGATTTTATVAWTVASGGGPFVVEYGPVGFVPGPGSQMVTSATTSATIGGLTPGTEYEYYVSQRCGSTPSRRSPAGRFRSDCLAPPFGALPFGESFENTWLSRCGTRDVPGSSWRNLPATGELSWRRDDDGAAAGWAFASGTYTPGGAAGSTHSARFHSSSNTAGQHGTLDLYLDLSAAGGKRLSFQLANLDGTDTLAVQLSTDGGATFGPALLQLAPPVGGGAPGFQLHQLTLTATSATSVIRFRATSDYGFSDLGLDDVRVEALSGCLAPQSLTVTGTTATSAGVAWPGAAAGTYTVLYGPVGFVPGGPGSQQITGLTGGSTVIPGLLSNTAYQFYVRQDCGSAASLAAGPITFRTACLTPSYVALPFAETFETTWLSRCDTREVPGGAGWRTTPTTGDNSWRRDDDGGIAGWLSPTFGEYTPAGATGSAHSARFHSSGAAQGQAGSLDLFVSLAGGVSPELAFDYYNESGTDSLLVQFSTDGGLTFGRPLLGLGVAPGWQTSAVALPGASATTVLRFLAQSDYGFSDIGLDNVTVSACARVSRLDVTDSTDVTATVAFTPVAGTVSYTIVATPATGAPVTATAAASPVTLTGLQPQTVYTVRVTTDCGAGLASAPVAATFTTLPVFGPNDEPCRATPLTPGTPAVAATNFGATTTVPNGYQNPSCTPASLPQDVWFSFVAPAAATATAVTVTGNPAGQVRLFAASTCSGPFTELGCQASTGNNTAAGPLSLPALTPGTTYYVSVSGFGSADIAGPFTIGIATVLATGAGQLPQGEVSLYPNPSHDGTLTLHLRKVGAVGTVQAELLNSLGQRVRSLAVPVRGGTAEQALPVQGLAKGFYTLRLQVDGYTITRKVVLD